MKRILVMLKICQYDVHCWMVCNRKTNGTNLNAFYHQQIKQVTNKESGIGQALDFTETTLEAKNNWTIPIK